MRLSNISLPLIAGQVAAAALAFGPAVHAAGGFGGQDLYHVPVAWCAVQGSPAASNPNITGLNGVTDTSTDAALWRRHERPTDNIYVNVAGITFRSTIMNSWGSLNFPILADPDTTLGVQGDMRGENVNVAGVEFNAMINNCDAAYADPAYGMAGVGVTAVNANLFHDAAGDYVGTIGWGGCTESVITGDCTGAFDGRIVVIDNNYLYPTVADRTFPPSPADPAGNLQFIITDPLDQLVGHEFGHALSLDHRNPSTALMFGTSTDNSGDGNVDNIALNAVEIADLRLNAQNVTGVEIDPPRQINPGRFVTMRHVDQMRDGDGIDLASVKISRDITNGDMEFAAQFNGLLPSRLPGNLGVVFAIDTDRMQETGIPAEALKELGVPERLWPGTDLVLVAQAATLRQGKPVKARVRGLTHVNGDPIQLPGNELQWDFAQLIMHPHYADIRGKEPGRKLDAVPVYDVAIVRVPGGVANVAMDTPFGVKAAVFVGDGLNDVFGVDRVATFEMRLPDFPHCFVLEPGKPATEVEVLVEDLLPNRPVHALIGPDEVYRGQTGADGNMTLPLPIPEGTRAGLHLVTVGIDDTALTADCVVDVLPEDKDRGGITVDDPRIFSLLKSHEDLLHGQEDLIRQAGDIVREALMTRDLSNDEAKALIARYAKLLQRHSEMVERFEKLVAGLMRKAN